MISIAVSLICERSPAVQMLHLAFEGGESLNYPCLDLCGQPVLQSSIFFLAEALPVLVVAVALGDAGLDDRMIELCKFIILSKLIREDNLNPEDTELYYFRDDNKNYVQIIHNHEPYGVTEINDEFYQGMEERFGTGLPDIRKSEEVIDRNWALRSIRAATKN